MSKIPCIVLVDDDETTNFVNSYVLRKSGLVDTILVASNGRKALELIETQLDNNDIELSAEVPLLVMLDMKMPIMDGLEFMEYIEKLEERIKAKVIIVVLTTSNNLDDMEVMYRLGVHGFISKPLKEEKLRELAAQYFN